jgi:hypothetical protein
LKYDLSGRVVLKGAMTSRLQKLIDELEEEERI